LFFIAANLGTWALIYHRRNRAEIAKWRKKTWCLRLCSIQRLAEARGIKLVRSGKELIGLCPFHDDRNPSLNIDPAKNVWSCKGACGEGGDVILWVMRAEGVSFHHALELLKRDHFSLAAGPIQPIKTSTVRKLPTLIDATADDKKLLGIVVDYYHRTLKDSPEAERYLVKRGLQSGEIIDRFKLGYANRTLCLHTSCRLNTVMTSWHELFPISIVI
jgi:DNA primase